jgi:uncharacterized membrane protein
MSPVDHLLAIPTILILARIIFGQMNIGSVVFGFWADDPNFTRKGSVVLTNYLIQMLLPLALIQSYN